MFQVTAEITRRAGSGPSSVVWNAPTFQTSDERHRQAAPPVGRNIVMFHGPTGLAQPHLEHHVLRATAGRGRDPAKQAFFGHP